MEKNVYLNFFVGLPTMEILYMSIHSQFAIL